MSVIDSIQQARQKGASDDLIVQEILKQNPKKAAVFEQARQKGAKADMILNEIIKQNTKETPKIVEPPKKEGFFNTGGEGIMGRLRVPDEELKSTNNSVLGGNFSPSSIIKAGVRPIVNLLYGMPAETAKKTFYDIPKGAIELNKEQQGMTPLAKAKIGAESAIDTFKNIGGSILKPFSYLGKVEIGAIQKGLEKIGIKLPGPQAQAMNDTFSGFVDTIKNKKLDTAGQFAEDVYKTVEEYPEAVMFVGQQINGLMGKAGYQNFDIISKTASPVTGGAEILKNYGVKTFTELAQKTRPELINKMASTYEQKLPMSKSVRTNTDPKVFQTMAEEQIPFSTKKVGGKKLFDADPGTEILQNKVNLLEEVNDGLLKSEGKFVSLDEWAKNAKGVIAENPAYRQGGKVAETSAKIDKLVDDVKMDYRNRGMGIEEGGDLKIPLDEFNGVKSAKWKASGDFTTDVSRSAMEANKQLGFSAKTMIEDATTGPTQALNRQIGDYIQAMEVLAKANNGIISGGLMSRFTTKILGAVAGSSFGPVGTLAGATIADALADIIMNPRFVGIRQKVLLSLTEAGNTQLIKQAMEIVKQRQIEGLNRLRLSSPSFIEGQPYKGNPNPPLKTQVLPATEGTPIVTNPIEGNSRMAENPTITKTFKSN